MPVGTCGVTHSNVFYRGVPMGRVVVVMVGECVRGRGEVCVGGGWGGSGGAINAPLVLPGVRSGLGFQEETVPKSRGNGVVGGRACDRCTSAASAPRRPCQRRVGQRLTPSSGWRSPLPNASARPQRPSHRPAPADAASAPPSQPPVAAGTPLLEPRCRPTPLNCALGQPLPHLPQPPRTDDEVGSVGLCPRVWTGR